MFNEDQAAKMCMNCNEGKKAISYCFVCKYYFCSSCEKAHRRLRVTRDHRNVLLEKDLLQLLKEPVMSEKEGHDGKDLLYLLLRRLQRVYLPHLSGWPLAT